MDCSDVFQHIHSFQGITWSSQVISNFTRSISKRITCPSILRPPAFLEARYATSIIATAYACARVCVCVCQCVTASPHIVYRSSHDSSVAFYSNSFYNSTRIYHWKGVDNSRRTICSHSLSLQGFNMSAYFRQAQFFWKLLVYYLNSRWTCNLY